MGVHFGPLRIAPSNHVPTDRVIFDGLENNRSRALNSIPHPVARGDLGAASFTINASAASNSTTTNSNAARSRLTDPAPPTPLVISTLLARLDQYRHPDRTFLLDGLSNGFRVPVLHWPSSVIDAPEIRRTFRDSAFLSQFITKELELHRVIGPFREPPFSVCVISPIHVVRQSSGKARVIHNLSYSESGFAVNAAISDADASVSYQSFDDAITMIENIGPSAFLFKCDVKEAYKLLATRPSDIPLCGFRCLGSIYFDRTLPFGLRSSCKTWESFACFLEWAFKQSAKTANLRHYVDDFLGAERDFHLASQSKHSILASAAHFGLPMSIAKCIGPQQKLDYLGISIDVANRRLELPPSKIARLTLLLRTALTNRRIQGTKLQSMLGLLSFACKVFIMARPFLRTSFVFLASFANMHHFKSVPAVCKADWSMFLRLTTLGVGYRKLFLGPFVPTSTLCIFSDACSSFGFGLVFQQRWAAAPWDPAFLSSRTCRDITLLEIVPILVALLLWGPLLADQKLLWFSDNEAVTHCINKMTSKEIRVTSVLRKIVIVCVRRNIVIKCRHQPGLLNAPADALSRGQLNRFRSLCPLASPEPDPIGSEIWSELLSIF